MPTFFIRLFYQESPLYQVSIKCSLSLLCNNLVHICYIYVLADFASSFYEKICSDTICKATYFNKNKLLIRLLMAPIYTYMQNERKDIRTHVRIRYISLIHIIFLPFSFFPLCRFHHKYLFSF